MRMRTGMAAVFACGLMAAGATWGAQASWGAAEQPSRAGASAAAQAAHAQSGEKPEQQVELHYKGMELDGVVPAEHCTGKIMRLTVKNAKGPVVLHSADYARVGYNSDLPNKGSDIDPCTELKGRTVKVWFTDTKTKGYRGEIEHIEIVK